ncbi:hypothetical protein [Fimbriimonas ginsengisoli]|uniref:Uncharacterized protein n=1 Tax=Fimbriimonas ginsengisoli Gsoil 348 TaxID=661478 RepID=A0A068NR76_FIMGI|nr:hypothetical protein [Fimbriimonas ginsengisoli]AIE84069.1 hypothetical protein OP10G_0701 [Fimbriimonas ginsengisoli Gsoil 348]
MSMRLTFDGCRIAGGGSDNDGPFTLSGTYDPGTETVQLMKAYRILLVSYEGSWNGRFITGVSVIGHPFPFDLGTFEMWPEAEETSLEELIEAVADRRFV